MQHGLKIRPQSSYITPLYARWSMAEATEKQIVKEFSEMLEKDFDRLEVDKEDRPFFDEQTDYGFQCYPDYYRHKTNSRIFAITYTNICEKPNPYVQKTEIYYRLFDFSFDVQHPQYGVVRHLNPGECLTHPVHNAAPHISVAENGLVMLRPTRSSEDVAESILRSAPILKS